MNRKSIVKLVLTGMMVALVFLATYTTKIPIPMTKGYFNVGDSVIIVTAILLGRNSGLIAGGLGAALSDFLGGYLVFAPATLVIKALEGFAAGWIANGGRENSGNAIVRRIVAIVCGVSIMVAGYFLAEAYILGAFDKTLGLAAAVSELPINLLQAGISAVVGYTLSTLLLKLNVKKYL